MLRVIATMDARARDVVLQQHLDRQQQLEARYREESKRQPDARTMTREELQAAMDREVQWGQVWDAVAKGFEDIRFGGLGLAAGGGEQ